MGIAEAMAMSARDAHSRTASPAISAAVARSCWMSSLKCASSWWRLCLSAQAQRCATGSSSALTVAGKGTWSGLRAHMPFTDTGLDPTGSGSHKHKGAPRKGTHAGRVGEPKHIGPGASYHRMSCKCVGPPERGVSIADPALYISRCAETRSVELQYDSFTGQDIVFIAPLDLVNKHGAAEGLPNVGKGQCKKGALH